MINFSVLSPLNLILKYHPLWLVLPVLVAFGYAFYLYRKDRLLEDVAKNLVRLMAALRFLSVFFIVLLLLGFVVENVKERSELPLVFIAQDNSESVVMTKDSNFYKQQYKDQLLGEVEKLKQEYDVVEYSFGEKISDQLTFDFKEKSTDIARLFETIFEQYSGRNIGAIVLASDGIYNQGSNPIYTVNTKSFVPVYTIGLGDTNLVRDIKANHVSHNDVAFLGNEFPVEFSFSGIKTAGEKVVVTIHQGDKQIAKQEHVFKDDFEQAKVLFMIRANGKGFQRYSARVSTVDGEFSDKNNEISFYVEVIDGRQKILIAHDAPHPDVAALRFVIENNQNYQTEVKFLNEVNAINEYDLVIIHNYQKGNSLIDDATLNGAVPLLFINGLNTDMKSLQNLKIGFSGYGNSSEELGFAYNTSFKDILLSDKIIKWLSGCPPLHAPFGNISYSNALDVLAFQKVGNMTLSNPLIYFTFKEKSRIGVIMGEGIWRWRLYDQMRNNSTLLFEEFAGKLITYLAVKDNKDPFRVKLENEYFENQDIVINAELYNKSFELINEPDVNFVFTNEDNKEFPMMFLRKGNAYQLNIGRLKAGLYKWQASTVFQDQKYVREGNFLVKEMKLEWVNTTADHRLLRNISSTTGGKFFLPNQTNMLAAELMKDENLATVVYQEKSFDDIIDFKWLFILIVLLLFAEWFFRKYNGAY